MSDANFRIGYPDTKHTQLPDGSWVPVVSLSADTSGGPDRELVVTTYRVKTAFTGASVGDTITATQVIDVSGAPTTISTIWRNQTTATDLAGAPLAANLEIVGAQALTDAQLRLSPVAVNATDLGTRADASATSDTGTFSIIALVKRGLVNWTTLLSRTPALVSGRVPVDGSGVTQPVSGPLTDTQLRASAVPVSAASLPLPTGAATDATSQAIRDRLPTTAHAQPLTDTQLRATAVPVSGPLTDAQLRATAVTVTGAVTANTGLTQPLTDAQLRASRVPVSSSIPTATSGTVLSLTTNATGTTYTAFASQVCIALDIVNNTGVTIEYRRGAAGTAMQIPTGSARMVIGITNANQIDVRRTDISNTQVTLQAEAFTA